MQRMVLALAVIIGMWLSAVAHAENMGLYLAPKFLMSIQNSGRMEHSGSLSGAGIDQYSQFTLGGALAVGYDFWPQQMLPLRAELELALRGNSETTWDGGLMEEVKATWNSTTLFANLYWDFHNNTIVTPYVGGGIGMAFNYAGYDFTTRSGDTFSGDERSTNFAWNLGLGAAFTINDHFSIDAAYRFASLGYNDVSVASGGRQYSIGNTSYANEFMLGLRYGF